jgi:hypothetical protein
MARAHAFWTVNHTLFNDRVLKLGTFSPNLTGGCALFNIEGVLQADWPSTLNLAQTTDAMEFEALVPVGRWKGFGGVTNFNNAGFQSFFWASAISASTRVFPTTRAESSGSVSIIKSTRSFSLHAPAAAGRKSERCHLQFKDDHKHLQALRVGKNRFLQARLC